MSLLEELKQRTSDAKSLVENETRNLAYLEEHYQIVLTKIKESADLGNSFRIIDIPQRYGCTNYVIKRLTEENLIISGNSSYTTESEWMGYIEHEIYNQFKVSW